MMVAEKAADLVLGNTPLPPAEVAFYRRTALVPSGGDRPSDPR
jgi:choline dehydrogenase